MAKHKEVQRWAAGWEVFEEKFFVVCATLVETNKQWRLKKNKDGTLGSAERQFSTAVGYRQIWDKDAYPTVGWETQMGAIKGLCDDAAKQVKEAQNVLRARVAAQEKLWDQLNKKEWRTLRTEHEQ